jgi:hypothetical protein
MSPDAIRQVALKESHDIFKGYSSDLSTEIRGDNSQISASPRKEYVSALSHLLL